MTVTAKDIRIDAYVEASSGRRVSRITHLTSGMIIMWNGRITTKNAIAEVERSLRGSRPDNATDADGSGQ